MRAVAGLPLVHQDPWVLVVEKPEGLLSQPGLGPDAQDSLITRLQQWDSRLALVHRLDRDTSGLLLVARTPEALRACSALFAKRQVRKLYVADVLVAPKGSSGCIDIPLARLQRQPPRYGFHPQGRASQTRWRLASKAGLAGCMRVWLQPLTGRSHQLRAHLAAQGSPILGDPIYADHLRCVASGASPTSRMHLHALALSFRHPFTGARLRCRSLIPF